MLSVLIFVIVSFIYVKKSLMFLCLYLRFCWKQIFCVKKIPIYTYLCTCKIWKIVGRGETKTLR